jgi:tRNA(adenine34) deaminase
MDIKYMKKAIRIASNAADKGEIPVGAVIVCGDKVVASAHNLRIINSDATAHAEVVAIRKAGKKLGRWNLADCDMYVTLEPCAMCAGAIVNARIKNLYFGAFDKRFGCCGTLINIASFKQLNHRANVVGGILEEECSAMLSGYFKEMRKRSKSEKAFSEENRQAEEIEIELSNHSERQLEKE